MEPIQIPTVPLVLEHLLQMNTTEYTLTEHPLSVTRFPANRRGTRYSDPEAQQTEQGPLLETRATFLCSIAAPFHTRQQGNG
jgi:hypothetical protein